MCADYDVSQFQPKKLDLLLKPIQFSVLLVWLFVWCLNFSLKLSDFMQESNAVLKNDLYREFWFTTTD